MKKIIFGLVVCVTLSSFESNAEQNPHNTSLNIKHFESNDEIPLDIKYNKQNSKVESNAKIQLNPDTTFSDIEYDKQISKSNDDQIRYNNTKYNEQISEIEYPSNSKSSTWINKKKKKKKTKELIFLLNEMRNLLLNVKLQVNDNQYLNDPTFKKFGKNLIIFNKLMNNPGTHRDTISGKGKEIFSDSNNKFFRSESIPSDLKNLYFNVLNDWEKIKDEENLKEKLDDFKKNIEPLVNIFQPNPN